MPILSAKMMSECVTVDARGPFGNISDKKKGGKLLGGCKDQPYAGAYNCTFFFLFFFLLAEDVHIW